MTKICKLNNTTLVIWVRSVLSDIPSKNSIFFLLSSIFLSEPNIKGFEFDKIGNACGMVLEALK